MKQIRESKFSKIVIYYLIIMMFLQITQPMQMYALTGGPTQPEFNSFTPIGTSDMVDLASGDFNYNIPVMDVGGYPLNLAYNSGVTMDQEASWVGLGWDMSVGQIARQVRGLPDDFNGDPMTYENNMKPNTTVGGNVNVFVAPFGAGESLNLSGSVGLGVKYNNYDGLGFSINGGLTYQVNDNLSVGMNLESSSTDGVSASPSVSFSAKLKDKQNGDSKVGANLGVSMNSRKGVETLTMSASNTRVTTAGVKGGGKNADGTANMGTHQRSEGGSAGGSVTYNDASFTPSKRIGMTSSNTMFSLNVEGAVYGIDPGLKFSGYRNSQGIKDSEKFKVERAFGYENTNNAGLNDVLDFNREKDRTFNKSTVSLPLTNYTHDLYSIQGQGIGGMYRPYKGQVGYVFDNYVRDDSSGDNLGGELGAGVGVHFGIDYARTDSKSSTGLWYKGNGALSRTLEKKTGNNPNYEKVFFKNIGGTHVDKEMKTLLDNKLGGYDPISFKIEGSRFSRYSEPYYYDKFLSTRKDVGSEPYIKRSDKRLNRNQIIQNITREEAYKFGTKSFSPYTNRKKQGHHTSEVRIIKDGGERYNYGRAAYNISKKEVTFDISGQSGNCEKGTVSYNPGSDNSVNNNRKGDQYFNRITTPPFAHTYLLTSVLSSDYQDVDAKEGPSDGDLGTYTKFSYTNKNAKTPYKWRVPYGKNIANFDEGLRSLNKDNKASYQYGEKELLYINKIETKTHIAIFTISARKDGLGVIDENGGKNTEDPSKMWKLEKISLYSKPEYIEKGEEATPIKVAHFEYDYSLCKGIENSVDFGKTGQNGYENETGKLTLKKVYFTYRNSNMGKYTPYKFNYDPNNNPNYDQKGYDVWGNYKPTISGSGCGTNDPVSNAEFPYVNQSDKALADKNSSAWLLKSINLPSGGEMELNYESDDYKYVQNRDVMQMFKVVGAGNTSSPSNPISNQTLYGSNYLYLKLDKRSASNTDFYNKYIKNLIGKPMYFRFLLNMTKPGLATPDKFDYVTGYLNLEDKPGNYTIIGDGTYAAIKISNGGVFGSINPITKAGFYFGRQYLNSVMYSINGDEELNTSNLEAIVKTIVKLIPDIFNIFRNPDAELIDNRIANNFVADKSWIRLMQPDAIKYGGGSRVKEIKIKDNWDVMTNHNGEEVYAQFYGQQYSYTGKDEVSSSGVATYEPLASKENPFVEPFYDRAHSEVLLGPDITNYVEMPFGESFFPAPKITYSRVKVKNLPREKSVNNLNNEEIITVKKHATGEVVSEFFTSFDYPTISDLSKISSKYDDSDLASILDINVETHLTLAQGFSIHTNDMDGKAKNQWVYAEGQKTPISGMEYKYEKLESNEPNKGKLNNNVLTVDSQGKIEENTVGVDYDVINDFRENNSSTNTSGIHFNTEGLPLFLVFVIVPIPIPSFSNHENIMRSAVTTKVIHSTGILRETIAYDLGSVVSTKNLAWDADTGAVLLTETVNEYNDKYFSFNFPAYWANEGMSQGALNIGMQTAISSIGNNKYEMDGVYNAKDYLVDGDEIWVTGKTPLNKKGFKAWVVNVKEDTFNIINEKGILISSQVTNNPDKVTLSNGNIKVIKSGRRNMQSASMASVTLMKNPLYNYINNVIGSIKPNISNVNGDIFKTDNWDEYKIVNASAIEYKNEWASQCECDLPKMRFDIKGKLKYEYNQNSTDDDDIIEKRSFNPYKYNVLGNWRAVKSYAYLTGRNNSADPTPRNTGFFKDFRSFYVFNNAEKRWKPTTTDINKWTFASEVSQYNPSGQELENKDALNRYSSALYGYNNRFPVAVASNTKYKELGYDGFEDYSFSNCNLKSHFSFDEALEKNKVSISSKESHTGRKSIRLEPGVKAAIKKKIVQCATPAVIRQSSTKITAKK
jgi:hypothetical protein